MVESKAVAKLRADAAALGFEIQPAGTHAANWQIMRYLREELTKQNVHVPADSVITNRVKETEKQDP